jgi:hypothetical protein
VQRFDIFVYLSRRGRLAEWLKRSRSDQEVAGANSSYDSVFDAAALGKLLTSGIATPLMQLTSREPGFNHIIININNNNNYYYYYYVRQH